MSDSKRFHVVLVPGFAGFDVLGDIEYYAGITPLFQRWQAERPAGAPPCELHYFDNLPTASVATRAERLRRFLAKRVARGAFAPGDTVALVGHSTGGLDIRRLVCDLALAEERPIAADGDAEAMTARELLGCIRHLVFLSVPQYGTNIADWVHTYDWQRRAVVAAMRDGVAAAGLEPIERLEARVAQLGARGLDADLFVAVKDALDQMHAPPHARSIDRAEADETASHLALWLRHIASDFGAIDDLRAEPASGSLAAPAAPEPPPPDLSPAHFGAAQRAWERRTWAAIPADTLSYATLGWRPFAFTPGRPAPVWRLLDPDTGPGAGLVPGAEEATDLPYRVAYRACAGGPFVAASGAGAGDLRTGLRVTPEIWDNDGIVNTASMLWPDGGETRLVHGDHGDVIGHHRLEPPDADARDHVSYDLLRSERSGREFDDDVLETVWRGVFSFCAR